MCECVVFFILFFFLQKGNLKISEDIETLDTILKQQTSVLPVPHCVPPHCCLRLSLQVWYASAIGFITPQKDGSRPKKVEWSAQGPMSTNVFVSRVETQFLSASPAEFLLRVRFSRCWISQSCSECPSSQWGSHRDQAQQSKHPTLCIVTISLTWVLRMARACEDATFLHSRLPLATDVYWGHYSPVFSNFES